MQEEQWVTRLQAGEEQALQEIIQEYARPVHYVIGCVLGEHNCTACGELTNDTFYTLWRKADKVDLSKGSLKALVCTIGRNLAINYIRSHKKQRLEVAFGDYDAAAEDSVGPEGYWIQQENIRELLETIKELGEPDSTIFKYRFYYFYPITSIAEKMNMKREQIDNHLSKGRKKLSALLKKKEAI